MKLTIERNALQKALARVTGVVERRNTIPILSNVLISADAEGLSMTATDLDIDARGRIVAHVEEEGAVTAPAGLLSDIVRNAPEGSEISLSYGDDDPRLIVKFGRSRYQVPVLPAGDFPIAPELNGATQMAVSAVDLKQAFERVGFSISTEEVRQYLKGVFLHLYHDDGAAQLRLVSTDGHRLSYAVLPPPAGAEGAPPVIVPAKTVREVSRALADYVGDVTLDVSASGVRFTLGETVIRSKVIDGAFPDYIRLIPRSWTVEAVMDRALVAAAVRRVSLMAGDKARSMKVSFTRDLMTLQVRNDQAGVAVEEVEIEYDGQPHDTGFNARYALDALGMTEADRIVYRQEDGDSPARIEPEASDPEAGQVLGIIMPLRV